uniref:hypothetical protein n=1 Tax=Ningiella ruwaisensis TaxID=2364274 RepID=UPI00109FDD76|nr:hypothetical protein [Ningiella ruwaisensis]
MSAQFIEKFEALAFSEKRLIFIATPSLIVFVLSLLFIEPMYKNVKSAQANVDTKHAQLDMLKQTRHMLSAEIKQDPDANTKQQIADLKAQLAYIESSFDNELGQLVSPQAMPILLEQLFEQAKDLKLVKMESIAPTPVFDSSNAHLQTQHQQSGDKAKPQLYRQGIRITFQGSYFATRDFFADAETLKWKLYWRYLNYDVDSHPLATTELEVFTLSTSEAFIGVN